LHCASVLVNQPGACEPLFSAWRDSGQQDPLAYLERIRLAMKGGAGKGQNAVRIVSQGDHGAGDALVVGRHLLGQGKNQPGACEPLFSAWRDSGQQDPLAYLERIRLAMPSPRWCGQRSERC
jgi:hypothetical protein